MSITILLSLLTLVGAQLLAQSIASVTLVLGLPEFICNILAGILYIVMAHRLVKLICRKYLRVDMSELNIPRAKISLEWLVVAIALPVFVSVCYLLMDGALQVNNAELGTKLSLVTAGIFFTGFGAGIVEEMVFRGIIMYAVEKRFNRKAAIIAPSVLFGVVHIIGMEFELLSCILVVFAGTMVGIMFSLIACT
ncbi:MAG: CPBP family intramembrane metalloprotease, partial [Lachnospiraceae bacterium]|nr:CPBP family intramembrane metalloprotease [Lachnospiraceae bacterium]